MNRKLKLPEKLQYLKIEYQMIQKIRDKMKNSNFIEPHSVSIYRSFHFSITGLMLGRKTEYLPQT